MRACIDTLLRAEQAKRTAPAFKPALSPGAAMALPVAPAFEADEAALRDGVLRELCSFARAPLSSGWTTAAHLRRRLHPAPAKLGLNRVLYALHKEGHVDFAAGSPPSWRMRGVIPDGGAPQAGDLCETEDAVLHVIVDLGNCHDCLYNLVEYAERGALTAHAYADLAFGGFGVARGTGPALSAPNVQIWQSDTPDKNSADVQIIWDVSRLVDRVRTEQPGQRLHIIVATKDLGFQRLKTLVNANPLHTLTFVTNWCTMRLHIE
jgi:hypothetical protein